MPGFVNIDACPDVHPDVVADCTDLSEYADGSVERIESYAFVEHLTCADFERALDNWFRILAPGGVLLMELPDAERCLDLYWLRPDYSERWTNEFLSLRGVYGGGKYELDKHKALWSRSQIRDVLVKHGYGRIRIGETQQRRKAQIANRDMRVTARKQRKDG